ncbi:hypothetical protein [Methanoregula sp.]|uniref:hypothetical protein n=1 Tax=Methanoregula sp. TaxID=2052170 RepID=UPI0035698723
MKNLIGGVLLTTGFRYDGAISESYVVTDPSRAPLKLWVSIATGGMVGSAPIIIS